MTAAFRMRGARLQACRVDSRVDVFKNTRSTGGNR